MDVKLPQLAEGVESGTVVSILVAEGQEVKKDQAIMELETQKAVGSIPAPSSGIVTKIYVKQGMEVAVGQALIAIESSGTASAASAKPPQAPATTEAPPAKPSALAANAAGNHCRGRGKLPLRVEKRRAATRAAVGAQDRARPWHRSNENQRQRGRRQNQSRRSARLCSALAADRLSQRAVKRAARRFRQRSDSGTERSHRFCQMGADTPGKNVAAPAHGQPPDGGIVDNDPENKSIRRRRHYRVAGAAQKACSRI